MPTANGHDQVELHHAAFLLTLRASRGRVPRRCLFGLVGVGFERLVEVGGLTVGADPDHVSRRHVDTQDPFLSAIQRSLPRATGRPAKVRKLVRRSVFSVPHRSDRLIGRDLARRTIVTRANGAIHGFVRGRRFEEVNQRPGDQALLRLKHAMQSEPDQLSRADQVLVAYATRMELLETLFDNLELAPARRAADRISSAVSPNFVEMAVRVGALEIGWFRPA